jgi:mannose-6-phosphate isomerase-like protein (cupin superfamily)
MAFAGADHGAGASVAILTLPPGTDQPAHSHPTEEVLVAVSGRATVFLGRYQARSVSVGEIARLPAGAAHRIENPGSAPFECVLVYGSSTIETVPTEARPTADQPPSRE